MIIYIICFIISCILIKVSDKVKSNKIVYFIINTIALLIPCLLAAFRDTSIGTDVEVYVKQLFEKSEISKDFSNYLNCNWWWIYRIKYVSDFEIGFTTLVYIVQKITHNIHFVLFFIQLGIVVPIFLGLKKIKGFENKIYLAMFIFYFSLYNIGLNTMRQMMSVALIFYGTCCLLYDKKGTIKFFSSLLLACCFHNSAIFAISIYFIYKLFNLKAEKKYFIRISSKISISLRSITLIIFLIAFILLISKLDILVKYVAILGFEDYSGYLDGEYSLVFSKIIRVLPVILLLIYSGKYYIRDDENSYIYIMLFIIAIGVSQFSSVTTYGERLSYVFQSFNIILVPFLCYAHPNKELNKILRILIMCYYIAYWYYYFVNGGSGETVPYKFYWE